MRVAVVGAGPAGVRAVEQLVRAGVRPLWLDEAPDGGGRIYQRPPAGFVRGARALYGLEARKARAVHATLDALKPLADWQPNTLAWDIGADPRLLHTLREGRAEAHGFDAAILCTGAMDRIMPLPGWTLPGVTTLGGAQIALKAQGCAIGRCVAFLGSGPLLWLAAYQYMKAGATVAAVLDTTPFAAKARALAGLPHDPATLAKGLYYVARLRAAGILVAEGVTPLAIEGDGERGVSALHWRDSSGRERWLDCDAVGLGWGVRPELQLADLAGVPIRFDAVQHNWVPERDAMGRTPLPGIYLAGDGAGIGGADVAEMTGACAAQALLADAGLRTEARLTRRLQGRLRRQARFRAALDRAFPFPAHLAAAMPDETILCRCEAVTAGELRAAATPEGPHGAAPEVNRAKAFTRIGMGRCQGRVCGMAAAEVLAARLGRGVAEIGRLRGQAPVKPLPIMAAPAGEDAA
ncbi:FAD/NAD(P)-binding oxidoreductase [Roseomonas sp. M0104]|uniref:FAD/NAD(P)-binding oxidoreductase n=1 Tax=Teichococcus coralli TaxID=2545983 RepID=A0A845BFP6_9PROT|nr:NAD(P)/FAD-dependent oxidoreductase [Pseudoroseomonas coralli]MXP65911.1 FAD/NAD(P)-binding oxidoreductase [Pseudoroseomonas coralli]